MNITKERLHTISCRPANGPLLNCVTKGFTAFEFAPAAAIARIWRWPSANSPLRVFVIDDAELIASCNSNWHHM